MRCVALRFVEDENIVDRTYWYGCPFPAGQGALLLAPVGSRNCLQLGRVERVYEGDTPPYDRALLKEVAAPAGARKLVAAGVACCELGGVRYDNKRYTRFQVGLAAEVLPERAALAAYGVTACVPAEDALPVLARERGCVLFYGRGAEGLGTLLIALCRGEGGAREALLRLGATQAQLDAILKRLL